MIMSNQAAMQHNCHAADELIAAGEAALTNWARWSRHGAGGYGQHASCVAWARDYRAGVDWDDGEVTAERVEAESPIDDQQAEWVEATIVLQMPGDLRRVTCVAYLGEGTARQRAGRLRLSVQEYRTAVLSACRWVGRALVLRTAL